MRQANQDRARKVKEQQDDDSVQWSDDVHGRVVHWQRATGQLTWSIGDVQRAPFVLSLSWANKEVSA